MLGVRRKEEETRRGRDEGEERGESKGEGEDVVGN